ncbi:hypothetical protein [Streptomyces cinnamoneus]|uniref:Uncharacterized protein n=1 Tax=Streptomyces cinnamoneus TaxID=53446 RepID=A0A918U024_STRCJ|nr:hypothetical protein [Streptomyces cinnamoneus]GHC64433.1 hypothetical protein GCM10010507_47220 [Streptomyces cinnamoneus]
MARHGKPKPLIDWNRVRRWVKTATPWVELFVALTALALILIGKA